MEKQEERKVILMKLSRLSSGIILLSLIIALFFEIFIWNYRFWFYNSNNTIHDPVVTKSGEEFIYGHLYNVDKELELYVNPGGGGLANIFIDIGECNNSYWLDPDRQCTVEIAVYAIDEGHADFYRLTKKTVSPYVKQSMYIPLEPYGKVEKIRLVIFKDFESIVINNIELNSGWPFQFNIFRFLLGFSILFISLYLLFHEFKYTDEGISKAKRIFVMGGTAIVTIGIVLSIQHIVPVAQSPSKEYNELVEAILNGRVYVEESNDTVLNGMINPYDSNLREKEGAEFYWDTAYYENRYYVYFGVVPALLIYLPYRIMTGHGMNTLSVHYILDVLLILAGFFLVNEMRKKYCEKLSLIMQVLFSITFSVSVGTILIIKRAAIYYIAIAAGLILVLFGLGLWMNTIAKGRVKLVNGILGSLCMALSVGCRPQFAVASFLGIFIFKDLIRTDIGKIKYLVAFIVPYIPVAAGLMWYNQVRFGSFFDFGANYNLTSHDMVHSGIHLAKIPTGLFYYLLNLPSFLPEFPYLRVMGVDCDYPGEIITEGQIGGVLFLIPLTCLCFLDLTGRIGRDGLRICCYICAFVVAITDTLMAGILTRYQMDFRLYLLFPAIYIAMEMINKMREEKHRKTGRFLVLLCLATLLMSVLTLLAQYEFPDWKHINGNPVFYCRLQSLLGN